jgi:hypothetical protein
MPIDVTTSLTAAMQRAADGLIDTIAKEGLVELRKILEKHGFSKSQYLKDYDVYAHVTGSWITFEIVLDVEAVVFEDEAAQKAVDDVAQQVASATEGATRTYTVSRPSLQVRTLKDVRKPARDARKPAKDIRKTAQDRLIEHELARLAPRSARVTRTGQLAVALQRSVRTSEKKVEFPQDKFQGILKDFVDSLKKILLTEFVPELEEIVEDYAL